MRDEQPSNLADIPTLAELAASSAEFREQLEHLLDESRDIYRHQQAIELAKLQRERRRREVQTSN
jgi:hypothetical protein